MTLAGALLALGLASALNPACLQADAGLQRLTPAGHCETLSGRGQLRVSPGADLELAWSGRRSDDVLVLDKHPSLVVRIANSGRVLDALHPDPQETGLNYFAIPAGSADPSVPLRIVAAARSELSLRYRLLPAHEFRALDIASERWSVTMLATLGVMALVNLFVFAVLRERAFGAYVCYIASLLLFFAMDEGRAYAWPLIGQLRIAGLGGVWAVGLLSAFFVVMFARAFAELDYFVPRLSGVLSVAQWTSLVLAAIALTPFAASIRPLFNLFLAVFAVLLIVAAWIAWRRGSRYAGYFLLGWVPLTLVTALTALGSEGWVPTDHGLRSLHRGVAALEAVLFSLGLADKALRYRRERDTLLSLSELDALTGVRNRRGLERALIGIADATRREQRPMSILFCDLDRFKSVNDRYGHDAGDRCLRFVADAIQTELRSNDVCGRQGGEEFLVLLPYADLADALAIAERIRKRIRSKPVPVGDAAIDLTVSIGAAQADDLLSGGFDALIARADRAMYRAKQHGRDRVATLTGDTDELDRHTPAPAG